MKIIHEYDYETDFFEFTLTPQELDLLNQLKPLKKSVCNKRVRRIMNILIKKEVKHAISKR